MAIEIKQVINRKDLKKFVEFPNILYKGNNCYVPKLFGDEMSTLDPEKNPAFKFCEAALYLAYKDGKIAGRVAAIVNNSANSKWDHKEVRFGWIDFIDDKEVSKALMDKVIEFGKSRGMTKVAGPLGFTDFDPEGMLVEGFDHLCTMALIYNHPYYPQHMLDMGLSKEIDWLEYKIFIPEEIPAKIVKIASIVEQKYDVHVRKITKKEIRKEKLGQKIFELVNETYGSLYNFTILPNDLIDKYIDNYFSFIDTEYITLIEDSAHNILAFGISIPGITRALQKCGGKLFPFGWFHVMKSMFFKHEPNVELLLIGVKPERRHQGLVAMIFNDLLPRYKAGGFTYAETNAELETNISVQAPWEMFESEQTKRRRIFAKEI